jgi:hypothetical protein
MGLIVVVEIIEEVASFAVVVVVHLPNLWFIK